MGPDTRFAPGTRAGKAGAPGEEEKLLERADGGGVEELREDAGGL
jgi:hypothetical protein